MTITTLNSLLQEVAKGNWFGRQTALLFAQICLDTQTVLTKYDQLPRVAISTMDLEAILAKYPGKTRGQSYKFWSEREQSTPYDVTNTDLISFAKDFLDLLREKKIILKPLWQVPADLKVAIITAKALIELLAKPYYSNGYISLPSQVKFQILEPQQDLFLSPIEGTFWRRNSPDSPLLVEVGDIVEPDQPICIVEIAKTFNSIVAENRLKIVAILVESEELVREGSPLFRIERLDDDQAD